MPNPHIKCMHITFAALLCVAAALMSGSAEAAVTNEGTAYRLDDGVAAYRETHMSCNCVLYDSGGKPARVVMYRCIDGSAFARKNVIERAGAATPDFDLIDGRNGYREGVRTSAHGREVYWQKSASTAEKTKRLEIPASAVIDSGFDATVRAHWPLLANGDGISASFLLPSALRYFKVSIEHVSTKPTAGVTRLRMQLDTWYGFVAPDTELDYRTSDQRLLRFKGIGSIRDGRGRNHAVRIEFPGDLQGQRASAGVIESLRSLPLTGQCGTRS